MSELHHRTRDIAPLPELTKIKNPVTGELRVNLPVHEVYQYLSDFELKKSWNKKIKDIRWEKDKINRAGTKHLCIMEHGSMKIETFRPDGEGHKMVYGEKTSSIPLVKEVATYYYLDSDSDTTNIKIELHYIPGVFPGRFLKSYIRKRMERAVNDFINSFPAQDHPEITGT